MTKTVKNLLIAAVAGFAAWSFLKPKAPGGSGSGTYYAVEAEDHWFPNTFATLDQARAWVKSQGIANAAIYPVVNGVAGTGVWA